MSHLYNQHGDNALHVAPHRQVLLDDNAADLSPSQIDSVKRRRFLGAKDPEFRYRDSGQNAMNQVALHELIQADNKHTREYFNLSLNGQTEDARKLMKKPTRIKVINTIMANSNLPIKISFDDEKNVFFASKNDGDPYPVNEMSDGERNAFLIAANVLTAKEGTLILLDEPERHLHRSIISPLLRQLFKERSDCAFVVSTHAIDLPRDSPDAKCLLVRDCTFAESNVTSWTIDELEPGHELSDELKGHILGGRRTFLFVEGDEKRSLDKKLYGILFPEATVVPKGNCRAVEETVKALKSVHGGHWIRPFGIVDGDGRTEEDKSKLKENGIWALPFYAVESFYYHPMIIARIAKEEAEDPDQEAGNLASKAADAAIEAITEAGDGLIKMEVERAARKRVFDNLPKESDIEENDTYEIKINIKELREGAKKKFDELVENKKLEGLLQR